MHETILLGNKIKTLPVHDKEAKSNIKSPPGYKIKYRKKVKTAAVQNKNYEIKKNVFLAHKDESGHRRKVGITQNQRETINREIIRDKQYEIKKNIFQLKKDEHYNKEQMDIAQNQRDTINRETIPDTTIRLAGKEKIIPDQSSENHENREINHSDITELPESQEIVSELSAVDNRKDQEVIQNNAGELPSSGEIIPDQSSDTHENREIIQSNSTELTGSKEILQDVDNCVKQKIIQNLLNTIRIGENTMQLCIIKNCKEEAYQDNFCPKHYSEIMKKGSHESAKASLPGKDDYHGKHGNSSYEQEDVMTKIQYFLHTFHVRIEKIIENAVLVFNRYFSLEKSDKAEIYRQLGAKYSRKRNYKKAIPLLRKYVETNPEDAESQYRLGTSYLSEGLSDEAIICFKKAIMLDPHAMQYHYEIAIAYTHKNLPGEAIASLKKALEINPKIADAYYRLGVLYDNNGEYENAIASYKKAIDLDPKQSNYHHSLGFAYESIKQHEQAVVNFKRAIALEQLAS